MKRTSNPGTIFTACPEKDKLHIAYHTAILASGFYRRRKYLVWHKVILKYARQCVVMPEWLEELSKEAWLQAQNDGKTMPIVLSDKLKKEVFEHEVEKASSAKVTDLELQWRKVEVDFWNTLSILLPININWVGSIEVRITKYASVSSHYLLERKPNQHLILHIRDDGDIVVLARTILLALVWPDKDKLSLSWSKRMAVADYLMSLEPMKQLLGVRQETFSDKVINESWRLKSEQYLKRLNVPQTIGALDLVRQQLSIFGEKESRVVLNILENKGEIISYNQMADLLWGEYDFGSFWAINKIIQRIRKKLVSIGLDDKQLKTVRGRGYVWMG